MIFKRKTLEDPMLKFKLLCLALLLPLLSDVQAQTPGEQFPEWSAGYLDLHHISTGRGDAAFYVFPDGTTNAADRTITEYEEVATSSTSWTETTSTTTTVAAAQTATTTTSS